MGYYINPKDGTSKEEFLARHGEKISQEAARDFKESENDDELVVCLVQNPGFTTAGICPDEYERHAFLHPCGRKKNWFVVKKDLLKEFM